MFMGSQSCVWSGPQADKIFIWAINFTSSHSPLIGVLPQDSSFSVHLVAVSHIVYKVLLGYASGDRAIDLDMLCGWQISDITLFNHVGSLPCVPLLRSITMLCGIDNIFAKYSPHSIWMWGIFHTILLVSHDIIMDLNNAIWALNMLNMLCAPPLQIKFCSLLVFFHKFKLTFGILGGVILSALFTRIIAHLNINH